MNTTSTLNMTSALKFKLYRHQRNALLHQRIDIAGCIWNHCIALHRRYYRLVGKHLNQFDLMRHLTRLKKLPRFAYWNKLGSQAIQDIAQRIAVLISCSFAISSKASRPHHPSFGKSRSIALSPLSKRAGSCWEETGYGFRDTCTNLANQETLLAP